MLFGCWIVSGWTVQVFGIVQELSGRSLKDTGHGLEPHWSVTGSGLSSGTQGHVWGRPRWDLQPAKRNENVLIEQQHTKTFTDIQIIQIYQNLCGYSDYSGWQNHTKAL